MEEAVRMEKAEAQRKEELQRKQAEMKRDMERRLAEQEEAWRKEAEARFAREAAAFQAQEAAEAAQQREFEAMWRRQEAERVRLEEERRVLQLEELRRKEATAKGALATEEMKKQLEGILWRQEAEERFKEEGERRRRERDEKKRRDEQARMSVLVQPIAGRLVPPPAATRAREVVRTSASPKPPAVAATDVVAPGSDPTTRRRSLDLTFRCPVCDAICDTQAALGAHVDEAHPPTPVVRRLNLATNNNNNAFRVKALPVPPTRTPTKGSIAVASPMPPTPRSARGGGGPNATVIHCQAILRGFLARRRYRRELLRARVVRELLASEAAYVQGLGRLIEVLLKPLRRAAEGGAGKPVLTAAEVSRLFGNVEEIHRLAAAFLPKLQRCIERWNVSTAVAELVATSTGSEAFVAAYCLYAKEFDTALSVLENVSKQSGFKAFVKIYEKDLEGKDVGAHLILPIQRPPRYVLLLKELIKHSRAYHSDYSRLQALETQLADLCRRMNDSRKDNDDQKLRVAHTRRVLEGLEPRPREVTEASVYVREGSLQLWDLDAGKRADRVYYLFKECFVVAEARRGKKAKVKMTVDLSTARVEALNDGASFLGQTCQYAFLLHTPRISFLFYCPSHDEKLHIVADLDASIHETRGRMF